MKARESQSRNIRRYAPSQASIPNSKSPSLKISEIGGPNVTLQALQVVRRNNSASTEAAETPVPRPVSETGFAQRKRRKIINTAQSDPVEEEEHRQEILPSFVSRSVNITDVSPFASARSRTESEYSSITDRLASSKERELASDTESLTDTMHSSRLASSTTVSLDTPRSLSDALEQSVYLTYKPEKPPKGGSVWYEISSLFPNRPATVLCNPDIILKRLDGAPFKFGDGGRATVKKVAVDGDGKKETALYYKFNQSAVQFAIVKKAFKLAGFKRLLKGSEWNTVWGKKFDKDDYSRLNEFQKINHFPGAYELGRKDNLHRHLSKMRRQHGSKEYGFFPEGYLYPEEKDHIGHEFDRATDDQSPIFIVKPKASSCGKGIKVVHKFSQITSMKKEALVQRYIANPMLIDGRKFDLRIYVVVTSFDPLRIYLHDDGLVRFATHEYSSKTSNLRNRFAHLTNYSVNKKAADFVRNKNAEEDGVGSKWSFRALRKYFEKNGLDYTKLWVDIKDCIVKTLIAVEPHMVSHFKRCVPSGKNVCYELFGFDVLLDESLKPWVLEVNSSPSLNSSSPLDKKIKLKVLSQMFTLVGFVPYDRKSLRDKAEEEQRKKVLGVAGSSHGVKSRPSLHQLKTQQSLNQLSFDDMLTIQELEDEYARRGSYERLFPLESNIDYYSKFFEVERYKNVLISMWLKEKAKLKASARGSSYKSSPRKSIDSVKPPMKLGGTLNSSLVYTLRTPFPPSNGSTVALQDTICKYLDM